MNTGPFAKHFKVGKRTRVSIELARVFARIRGGKCLFSTCESAKQPLKWQCNKLHPAWSATYDSVKRGSWCPHCSGTKKLSISDAKNEARRRGGKCLSDEYLNGKSHLIWQCGEHHPPWRAVLNSIRAGSWCPYCHAPGSGQGIPEMQKLAQERKGVCLSKKYKTAREKLAWQCFYKHSPWYATPDDVKSGRWCPQCSHGLGERIVREYFEKIFSKKFPNTRPKFLRNPSTGFNLELDGYCSSLKLAFEHQGRHHYSTTSMYSTTTKELKSRIQLDRLKKKLCANAGVTLVEVKSVPDMLSLRELPIFLTKEFKKKGVLVPDATDIAEIKIGKAFLNDSKPQIEKAKSWAKEKGGTCLSTGYLGFHGKLWWQCQFKHDAWEASPAKIYAGRWCPTCGGRKKKTLEQAQTLAKSFGGKCLAKKLINGNTKIFWGCKYGHSWKATFDSVNQGSRCPHCFNEWRLKGFEGVRR